MGFKRTKTAHRTIDKKLDNQILKFKDGMSSKVSFRKATKEFAKHIEEVKWRYLGLKEKLKR